MVNYETFIAVCESAVLYRLLSSYFPHPRLIVKYAASAETKNTYSSSIVLIGCAGKSEGEDRLLSLYVELGLFDPSLAALSPRLFEPCRIRKYDELRRCLERFVGMHYKPAEFAQHLVNAVSVEY